MVSFVNTLSKLLVSL